MSTDPLVARSLANLDRLVAASGGSPRDGQRRMTEAVAATIATLGRAEIAAPVGTGKALALDTPVPTPSGWTTMGELQPGDELFDERGEVCQVVEAHPVRLDRPCFAVEFSDGETIIADAEHIWATQDLRLRSRLQDRKRRIKPSDHPATQTAETLRAALHSLGEKEWGRRRDLALVLRNPGNLLYRARRKGALVVNGDDINLRALLKWGIACAEERLTPAPLPPYELVTTAEIARTIRGRNNMANHAVSVAGPLNLPDADLPIHPYLLGYWLGDGTGCNGNITVGTEDLAETTERLAGCWPGKVVDRESTGSAHTLSLVRPNSDLCTRGHDDWGPGNGDSKLCRSCPADKAAGVPASNTGLTTPLRQLGVLNNKHIPTLYLRASAAQRLELLRGLMDSDGSVGTRDRRCELSFTNRRLAQDSLELIRSLGIKATCNESDATMTYGGTRRVVGRRWRIGFATSTPVFSLSRKAAIAATADAKLEAVRYIISASPVPSVPVRCIAVDSPSRLFLVGRSMIPTHNTYGYLVPAVTAGLRTLVVTAGISLQDQLATKDLPAIRDGLGLPVTWQVLKGRSNMACLAKVSEVLSALKLGSETDLEVRRVAEWAAGSTSGDRSSMDGPVADDVWRKVSVGADECPGAAACQFGERCFAEKAKAAAQVAQVVVTNMHLFGLHAAQGNILESEDGGRFDVVIIDEAHELADVIASVNGGEITPVAVRALARSVHEMDADLPTGKELERIASDMRDVFSRVAGPGTVRLADGAAGHPELSQLFGDLLERVQLLAAVADQRRRQGTEAQISRAGRCNKRASLLAATLRTALGIDSDDGRPDAPEVADRSVHWVSSNGYEFAPISVSGWLVRNVWPGKAVIVTSGTMPSTIVDDLGLDGRLVSPGDYGDEDDLERGRLQSPAALAKAGIEPLDGEGKRTRIVRDVETLRLRVPSPFNFKDQSMLYVAKDLPHPTKARALWEQAALDRAAELVEWSGGGAMVLCTSMRMVEAFTNRLDEEGWMVYAQGDGPKQMLVNYYADDHDSVLVGTRGFWTGTDVVGSSNRLVIIDRMPLPRPDDPMIGARRDRIVARLTKPGRAKDGSVRAALSPDDAARSAFLQVDVPFAATTFAQGVGRLIRSTSDHGVVAVLDPRLATASYRAQLLVDVPLPRTIDARVVQQKMREWFPKVGVR